MQEHSGFPVVAEDFLSQLDRSTEFEIPKTGLLTVKTKNSTYQFDLGAGLGRGGFIGEEWVRAEPRGATFGGSMIMDNRLIVGSYMEFAKEWNGVWNIATSTAVEDIRYRAEKDM